MQGNAEVDKLFAFGDSVHSCHEEGKMILYGFSDEKSLAYTSSSIDGDKLRFIGVYIFIEQFEFCFSSYQSLFHIFRYFLRKDNASERNESLLSNCRVQLIFCKDIKKKPLAQIIRG